ncbi:transport protein%2C potassium [Neisseria meningitidis]|nr:transport protein%2C potassium [Neisseria meningitidis]
MHKILPIAHVLSRLGMLFSFILLIPAALSYAFSDGAYTAFATTATVTLSGSYIVRLATLRFRRELRPRDGFTLVLICGWRLPLWRRCRCTCISRIWALPTHFLNRCRD